MIIFEWVQRRGDYSRGGDFFQRRGIIQGGRLFDNLRKYLTIRAASLAAMQAVADEVNASTGKTMTAEQVALGFVEVANEAMCRPIRAITQVQLSLELST